MFTRIHDPTLYVALKDVVFQQQVCQCQRPQVSRSGNSPSNEETVGFKVKTYSREDLQKQIYRERWTPLSIWALLGVLLQLSTGCTCRPHISQSKQHGASKTGINRSSEDTKYISPKMENISFRSSETPHLSKGVRTEKGYLNIENTAILYNTKQSQQSSQNSSPTNPENTTIRYEKILNRVVNKTKLYDASKLSTEESKRFTRDLEYYTIPPPMPLTFPQYEDWHSPTIKEKRCRNSDSQRGLHKRNYPERRLIDHTSSYTPVHLQTGGRIDGHSEQGNSDDNTILDSERNKRISRWHYRPLLCFQRRDLTGLYDTSGEQPIVMPREDERAHPRWGRRKGQSSSQRKSKYSTTLGGRYGHNKIAPHEYKRDIIQLGQIDKEHELQDDNSDCLAKLQQSKECKTDKQILQQQRMYVSKKETDRTKLIKTEKELISLPVNQDEYTGFTISAKSDETLKHTAPYLVSTVSTEEAMPHFITSQPVTFAEIAKHQSKKYLKSSEIQEEEYPDDTGNSILSIEREDTTLSANKLTEVIHAYPFPKDSTTESTYKTYLLGRNQVYNIPTNSYSVESLNEPNTINTETYLQPPHPANEDIVPDYNLKFLKPHFVPNKPKNLPETETTDSEYKTTLVGGDLVWETPLDYSTERKELQPQMVTSKGQESQIDNKTKNGKKLSDSFVTIDMLDNRGYKDQHVFDKQFQGKSNKGLVGSVNRKQNSSKIINLKINVNGRISKVVVLPSEEEDDISSNKTVHKDDIELIQSPQEVRENNGHGPLLGEPSLLVNDIELVNGQYVSTTIQQPHPLLQLRQWTNPGTETISPKFETTMINSNWVTTTPIGYTSVEGLHSDEIDDKAQLLRGQQYESTEGQRRPLHSTLGSYTQNYKNSAILGNQLRENIEYTDKSSNTKSYEYKFVDENTEQSFTRKNEGPKSYYTSEQTKEFTKSQYPSTKPLLPNEDILPKYETQFVNHEFASTEPIQWQDPNLVLNRSEFNIISLEEKGPQTTTTDLNLNKVSQPKVVLSKEQANIKNSKTAYTAQDLWQIDGQTHSRKTATSTKDNINEYFKPTEKFGQQEGTKESDDGVMDVYEKASFLNDSNLKLSVTENYDHKTNSYDSKFKYSTITAKSPIEISYNAKKKVTHNNSKSSEIYDDYDDTVAENILDRNSEQDTELVENISKSTISENYQDKIKPYVENDELYDDIQETDFQPQFTLKQSKSNKGMSELDFVQPPLPMNTSTKNYSLNTIPISTHRHDISMSDGRIEQFTNQSTVKNDDKTTIGIIHETTEQNVQELKTIHSVESYLTETSNEFIMQTTEINRYPFKTLDPKKQEHKLDQQTYERIENNLEENQHDQILKNTENKTSETSSNEEYISIGHFVNYSSDTVGETLTISPDEKSETETTENDSNDTVGETLTISPDKKSETGTTENDSSDTVGETLTISPDEKSETETTENDSSDTVGETLTIYPDKKSETETTENDSSDTVGETLMISPDEKCQTDTAENDMRYTVGEMLKISPDENSYSDITEENASTEELFTPNFAPFSFYKTEDYSSEYKEIEECTTYTLDSSQISPLTVAEQLTYGGKSSSNEISPIMAEITKMPMDKMFSNSNEITETKSTINEIVLTIEPISSVTQPTQKNKIVPKIDKSMSKEDEHLFKDEISRSALDNVVNNSDKEGIITDIDISEDITESTNLNEHKFIQYNEDSKQIKEILDGTTQDSVVTDLANGASKLTNPHNIYIAEVNGADQFNDTDKIAEENFEQQSYYIASPTIPSRSVGIGTTSENQQKENLYNPFTMQTVHVYQESTKLEDTTNTALEDTAFDTQAEHYTEIQRLNDYPSSIELIQPILSPTEFTVLNMQHELNQAKYGEDALQSSIRNGDLSTDVSCPNISTLSKNYGDSTSDIKTQQSMHGRSKILANIEEFSTEEIREVVDKTLQMLKHFETSTYLGVTDVTEEPTLPEIDPAPLAMKAERIFTTMKTTNSNNKEEIVENIRYTGIDHAGSFGTSENIRDMTEPSQYLITKDMPLQGQYGLVQSVHGYSGFDNDQRNELGLQSEFPLLTPQTRPFQAAVTSSKMHINEDNEPAKDISDISAVAVKENAQHMKENQSLKEFETILAVYQEIDPENKLTTDGSTNVGMSMETKEFSMQGISAVNTLFTPTDQVSSISANEHTSELLNDSVQLAQKLRETLNKLRELSEKDLPHLDNSDLKNEVKNLIQLLSDKLCFSVELPKPTSGASELSRSDSSLRSRYEENFIFTAETTPQMDTKHIETSESATDKSSISLSGVIQSTYDSPKEHSNSWLKPKYIEEPDKEQAILIKIGDEKFSESKSQEKLDIPVNNTSSIGSEIKLENKHQSFIEEGNKIINNYNSTLDNPQVGLSRNQQLMVTTFTENSPNFYPVHLQSKDVEPLSTNGQQIKHITDKVYKENVNDVYTTIKSKEINSLLNFGTEKFHNDDYKNEYRDEKLKPQENGKSAHEKNISDSRKHIEEKSNYIYTSSGIKTSGGEPMYSKQVIPTVSSKQILENQPLDTDTLGSRFRIEIPFLTSDKEQSFPQHFQPASLKDSFHKIKVFQPSENKQIYTHELSDGYMLNKIDQINYNAKDLYPQKPNYEPTLQHELQSTAPYLFAPHNDLVGQPYVNQQTFMYKNPSLQVNPQNLRPPYPVSIFSTETVTHPLLNKPTHFFSQTNLDRVSLENSQPYYIPNQQTHISQSQIQNNPKYLLTNAHNVPAEVSSHRTSIPVQHQSDRLYNEVTTPYYVTPEGYRLYENYLQKLFNQKMREYDSQMKKKLCEDPRSMENWQKYICKETSSEAINTRSEHKSYITTSAPARNTKAIMSRVVHELERNMADPSIGALRYYDRPSCKVCVHKRLDILKNMIVWLQGLVTGESAEKNIPCCY